MFMEAEEESPRSKMESPEALETLVKVPNSSIIRHGSLSSVRKFVFGLVIVCVIACSWVGSTQTAKSAYTGNFKAPFFSMWFGTSWMIILFPISTLFFYSTRQGGMKDLWR